MCRLHDYLLQHKVEHLAAYMCVCIIHTPFQLHKKVVDETPNLAFAIPTATNDGRVLIAQFVDVGICPFMSGVTGISQELWQHATFEVIVLHPLLLQGN